MKNSVLPLGIFFVFLFLACQHKEKDTSSKIKSDSVAKPTPEALRSQVVQPLPTGITLNGLQVAQADELISNLVDDNNSSDNRTNIWLSKRWVNKIRLLLQSESADGIRIYFAKQADGKNSIVIVSTKVAGSDPRAPSKFDHEDYFKHTSTFLTSLRASDADYKENHAADRGTMLYKSTSPCSGTQGCIITEFNHEIPCDTAYVYVRNLKQKPINTTSEWFPIELVQALDDELVAAQRQGKPADGIRIYFAKINKYALDNKRRCVFIFTTTMKDGNFHRDYFECYNPVIPDRLAKDHGEECPIHCNYATWPR